jgi:hypothetical protein
MSTDPSAAIGRIEAAVEESSRQSSVPARELADLATVIKRIESLIVEGTAHGPDGSAAAERISDIAFALHDREVETSLCDALDAAVHEINDGGALAQGNAERAQQLAELLRELSRRVRDMIAQPQAIRRSEPVGETNVALVSNPARRPMLDEGDGEDDTPPDGAFKTDVPEDDEFAQVVVALTAALPSLAEFGAPVPVPRTALAQDAVPLSDEALFRELLVETADEKKTAEREPVLPQPESPEETVIAVKSSNAALLDELVSPPTRSNEEEPSASAPPVGALGDTFLDDLLRDAAPSKNPGSEAPAEAVMEPPPEPQGPAEDSAPEASLALPPPSELARDADAAEPSADLTEHSAHHDGARDDKTQLSRQGQEHSAVDTGVPVVAESARPPGNDPSSLSPLPPITPNDDPADLFDLISPLPGNVASKPEGIDASSDRVPESAPAVRAPLAIPTPLDGKPEAPPPQQAHLSAAAAPAQPGTRAASNDPLAPVRALTEEEMIALFS